MRHRSGERSYQQIQARMRRETATAPRSIGKRDLGAYNRADTVRGIS
jgi:hypothetical protein